MRTRVLKHRGTGIAAPTGYKTIHRKADGTVETTFSRSDEKLIITDKKDGSAPHVMVRSRSGDKKVGYNFNWQWGGSASKAERESDINRGLNRLRSEYRQTGGMTKGKTMKHIASIPPEIWYSELAENGPEALSDRKNVRRLIDEFGFRVSPRKR